MTMTILAKQDGETMIQLGDRAHPPMFIVIEGADGAGTTTQTERVTTALRARGLSVVKTCEPSRGRIGKFIRQLLEGDEKQDPRVMTLLFAADRMDHLASEVLPALGAGNIVICDRYLLSSLIYQSRTGARLGFIEDVNRYAYIPCLTFVLTISPEEAARRRAARGGKPEMFEEAELQADICEKYRKHAEALVPRERVITVEGSLAEQHITEFIVHTIMKVAAGERL